MLLQINMYLKKIVIKYKKSGEWEKDANQLIKVKAYFLWSLRDKNLCLLSMKFEW